MKNKKNIFIISAVVLVVLISVFYFSRDKNTDSNVDGISSTNNSATTTIATTTKIVTTSTNKMSTYSNYLKINQRVLINGVYVTVKNVAYDGRCPTDVKCIQAGTVDIGVYLENKNISQNAIVTLGKPYSFNEKTITLNSVSPSKISTKTISPQDYKFLITVK